MTQTHTVESLRNFATEALVHAGLAPEVARIVGDRLLEADLFGHTTHGLAQLADYIEEIENGVMRTQGDPTVVNEFGGIAHWDANYLPGVWTTHLAVTDACARAESHGIGAVTVARSHHIGCLAAYLEQPARDNFAVLLLCSDPSDALVAPAGGVGPVLTPNPLAAGIPAQPDPIIMDISMSITTAGQCGRAKANGEEVGGPWLINKAGEATADPNALDDGGALLPVGGLDHGHKGFALGLLVDTLTQGLSGYGRIDDPDTWGAAVLAIAFAPQTFGRGDGFVEQVTNIVQRCRAVPTAPSIDSVRIPGERALANKRHALKNGLNLHPSVEESLTTLAQRLDIPLDHG